ncbi:Ig-like domain-containing protein [Neolewinella persica]|uniref:Ig-like domain-containing protein n=1 Tax=Neolewinella persica TaxID=70998 RepID=UPI00037477D8|nr:gliding motility-associated C-terminal domain-containing protein [Neolewinella persica]
MNRTLPLFTFRHRVLHYAAALLILLSVSSLNAQAGLVMFIDEAPADETVACFGDVRQPPRLRATRLLTPGIFDTVSVTAIDSFSAPNAPCVGGSVFHIWEINGRINSDREVQQVSFGPAPNGDGPTIDVSTLPPLRDSVDCLNINESGHPDSYDRWLGDRRIAVSARAQAGCSPLVSVDDDAPDALINFACNDSLTVTFTVTDLCGGMASVEFAYISVDTTAPFFVGIVPDTIVLNCGEAIPPVPDISLIECDTMPMTTYSETSSQVMDGSCQQYEFNVERTWTATDRCGNSTIIRRRYEIRDTEAPDFTRPFNINLTCLEDPFDLDLTGRPSELSDDCSPDETLVATFVDQVIGAGVCQNSFDVERTWTVTDLCGNSRVRVQQIRVRDNVPPNFTPPANNVVVSCENYLNTEITGQPFNLNDQCDETVNLRFEDEISPGACANNFTVAREWRIFDDCGNSRSFTQSLIVVDTTGPVLVTAPTDLLTSCNSGRPQEFVFNSWVQNLGGARFMDGCSPEGSLTIRLVETGTENYPLLPPIICQQADGSIRRLSVDIIVSDECGNSTTTTMQYRQTDEQPINIFDCPESLQVSTDDGACVVNVGLPPPTIQDQCSSGTPFQLNLRDTVAITSQAMNPGQLGSVPVDPLVFHLEIPDALPVNGFTTGIFTITLENVDAEGEDEFFFIYAEDGALLGTTERGTVQCETVVTVDSITPFQFTRYARDGVISIRLEPNIPAGRPGTFAINNLCQGGSVARIHLRQAAFRLTEIVYEVDIDGAGFNRVDPVDSLFTSLGVGLHQITYRATDCGGSSDECSYTITVEDREPPVITCPDDVILYAPANSCEVFLAVPLPTSITDNCAPYTITSERVPSGGGLAFFPFNYDPNLNSFQAQPIDLLLTDIPPNITDSIDLDVFYVGTFNNRRAVMEVVLPDGTILDTTHRGGATCNQQGVLSIRVSAEEVLAHLDADNQLPLQLRPQPVTVPPGQEGDGITPCNEDNIEEEGGDDGISGVYVMATYRTLFLNYFSEGATTTPLSSTTELNPIPEITFGLGVTEFSYLVADPVGNADTCTFLVTVRDTMAPTAVCIATTIFVDPSGLDESTVSPETIGGNSTDNCAIDSMWISPSVFNCDQTGQTQTLTLVVIDGSGNQSSCSTIVNIAPSPPVPTATTTLCGGDTLRLFANPPTIAAPGQTIYTYQWFDPDGMLISTQENPVIPGVDESREGAYRVVIRGLTGCEGEGVVNIDIGNIPTAPVITAPQRVCLGDNAILTSTSNYAGLIRYEWFRGQPGAGTLVGESPTASFGAPFANGQTSGNFYAIVYVNGCASPPSNVVVVGTTERPEISLEDDTAIVCELSEVTFSAQGQASLAYRWTGPNNFTSAGQSITLTDIQLENAGTYYVQAIRSEGCFSLPDSVTLTVLPASAPTTLEAVSAICLTDTLVLSAADTDGNRYLFSGPNGLEFDLDEPTLRIAPVVPAVEGQWTVRIQRGACPSAPSPAITVTIGASPLVQLTASPSPICEGNDVILQASSDITGATYEWRGPNGYFATGIAPVIQNAMMSDTGNYVLRATAPSGCYSEATLPVRILPGIVINSIDVSSGSCLSGGEPVSLAASISPSLTNGEVYTYRWVGPEGTSSNDTFNIPNVSLASNGTYRLEVMNDTGCVSPRFSMEVEFDFAPSAPVMPFTESGETAICAGEGLELFTNDFGNDVTYLWRLPDNTNIPTNQNSLRLEDIGPVLSGAFTVRVIRNGCTSLPSPARIITITPFPAITVMADDPACAGQPINFQATDLPGATYSWRGPNNFSSSLPNPTIVRAAPQTHAGTYSVVATIAGCSSDTMSIEVNVLPTPGVPVVQPIAPICISDDDAVLNLVVNPNTATEGATYQWFIQNGQVPVGEPTTSLSLQVADFGLFAGGGLFEFSVQADLNGCSSATSTPVTIRLDEIDTNFQPDAGRDTVICAGLYLLQAAAGGTGSGRWSIVEGNGDINIINPTSRTTAVQGLTEFGGPYQFAWTLSNGSCLNYAADTVMLTVTDGEEALAGDDVLACAREEVRLSATTVTFPGSGGRWSQALAQEILGVVIANPTDPNTVIRGLQPNNIYSFTWTVTSNCGVKSDNVLVTISDPSPFAGPDQVVCSGNRRTVLAADQATIGSSGRWSTPDPDITIVDAESSTTMVIGLVAGDNTFIWEVDEGFCNELSRDTVIISYVEPPQPRDDEYAVDFQGGTTFEPGENDNNPAGAIITFIDVPPGAVITDNGGGSFSFVSPINFVGELAVDYEVTSDGCTTATATVFFQIGKGIDCVPPNIFTPNNDGMNDAFVVPCLIDTDRFPNSEVTIYNQWGDEVFRSGQPYLSDWDGTFQGSPLPVATYFYTITFGDGREGASGSVRIER